jgi:hypothetical protein
MPNDPAAPDEIRFIRTRTGMTIEVASRTSASGNVSLRLSLVDAQRVGAGMAEAARAFASKVETGG